MDELDRRVVADHRWHHLEVEVPGKRLRLVWVQAVAEPQGEDGDMRIAHREVARIGLDLDDVAHELVPRVDVEAVILAQACREVEPRAVHVARGFQHDATYRAALAGTARD